MINKYKLIEQVASSTRVPRNHVEEVITAFIDLVMEKLSLNEKVNLSGFGIFEVKTRKGRLAADPRDPSKRITTPDVKVAKFRPGKTLKDTVK